ncbi:MAG: 16S rRNA (cytosine(967)-C(5))-methyltransferase RsmB [Candidatus Hydrogenedens sp.]|nr:16S rRNA (cytosine(967)-C(5))-methyltransferase RsmB [Candidatus Hydrogenedens sp.]
MPVDAVRDAAIDVLLRVFERDWQLDRSLDKTLRRKPVSDRGRRFMTQLVYGTVRHQLLCDAALQPICTQPLEKLPEAIRAILRMAVFQALFLDTVTRPAMVHTSVELAKKRGHAGLARLVNAVLRRAPNSLDDVKLPDPAQEPERYLNLRYSMPFWLVRRWKGEYGIDGARALCERFAAEAPMQLRVNTLKTTREQLQAWLAKKGIDTAPATGLPDELTVLKGPGLVQSEAFRRGDFMIQDAASMLPTYLLEPQPGERVLDLCAAPGGKTTHLAQLAGGKADITAMDLQFRKLALIRENIERLGTPGIRVLAADAAAPPFGVQFDRVLLDAPCSGLGTLRRHPELKYRVSEDSIRRLADRQRALLRSALRCVRPGGVVVYSVCTFTPEETTGVVEAVAAECGARFEDGPEILSPWAISQGQYQTRPGQEALDGFFLTRLRAPSSA